MAVPDSAIVTRLRAAGCVFAEDEARLLIAAARTPAELDAMVGQRVAGLPLEQVLGWAEFCGLRITVAPGVFVPRRRTEFLVRQAMALAPAVDGVDVHAADIDPAAVRCARQNLPADRVYQGDLYAPLPAVLRGRVAILAANVPYVPAREIELLPAEARAHEPRVALDGGADGLDVLRRVAIGAAEWLAPGGHLLSETSDRQAPLAEAVTTASGLAARVARSPDLDATVIIARRPSSG